MFGWEFPPFNSGGLGTACQGLTKGLSSKGIDITFVLPQKVNLNVDYLKLVFGDKKKHKNCYVINSLLQAYSTSESYEKKFLFESEEQIAYGNNLFEEVERYESIAENIAMNEEFEIIHAHDWLTFKAGVAAKKVSGKSLVVHVHATEFDRTAGNGNNQYIYEIEKYGMENADLIIAVSNFTKNKIIDHYGISPDKIRVVHNSVEFENYSLEKINWENKRQLALKTIINEEQEKEYRDYVSLSLQSTALGKIPEDPVPYMIYGEYGTGKKLLIGQVPSSPKRSKFIRMRS